MIFSKEDDFEVFLVNARHLKNVAGRKSDVLDCQWLQQLHTYGLFDRLLPPAPRQIVALRSVVRHRETLVQYRSAHIQHMQKALTVMNVRLTNVLSDISGVTGHEDHSRHPGRENAIRSVLAGFREPGCKKSDGRDCQIAGRAITSPSKCSCTPAGGGAV